MKSIDEITSTALLRSLPSVNRLLESPLLKPLVEENSQSLLTRCVREVLESLRGEIREGKGFVEIEEEAIVARVRASLAAKRCRSLHPAINATGVVLHTGLGRARLAESACVAVEQAARSHTTLEIDPESGQRGSRQDHVRGLLCELTSAEDALVLNNCAGAVFLAVNAVAVGREVLISRGELVEIGGAFRVPDIIRQSGATLVEVGTTNKTRLSDYEKALSANTALILRCHPSNFAMVGFTESASTEELVSLGKARGVPVMEDQGSGALFPLHDLGCDGFSGSLVESVESGCDLITASGDKLLGASQAGILLGKREMVREIAKHPLARALRIDKLTLAALEATLRLYWNPERAKQEIPTLRYLLRNPAEIKSLAVRLQRGLRTVLPKEGCTVEILKEVSEVGGGSLPGQSLPTYCVGIRSLSATAGNMAQKLREGSPAIFARIRQETLLFDLRTVEEGEIPLLVRVAAQALGTTSESSELS